MNKHCNTLMLLFLSISSLKNAQVICRSNCTSWCIWLYNLWASLAQSCEAYMSILLYKFIKQSACILQSPTCAIYTQYVVHHMRVLLRLLITNTHEVLKGIFHASSTASELQHTFMSLKQHCACRFFRIGNASLVALALCMCRLPLPLIPRIYCINWKSVLLFNQCTWVGWLINRFGIPLQASQPTFRYGKPIEE